MGEPCRRRALCRVARGVGRNVAWGLTEGGGEGGAHEWSLGWGGAKKQRGADERGRAPPKSRNAGKSYTKSQVLHKVSHKALHTTLSTQSSPHKALHTQFATPSYKYFPLIQVFSTCHTLISPHVSPAKYCSHSSDAWHTHTHTHTPCLSTRPFVSFPLFPQLRGETFGLRGDTAPDDDALWRAVRSEGASAIWEIAYGRPGGHARQTAIGHPEFFTADPAGKPIIGPPEDARTLVETTPVSPPPSRDSPSRALGNLNLWLVTLACDSGL